MSPLNSDSKPENLPKKAKAETVYVSNATPEKTDTQIAAVPSKPETVVPEKPEVVNPAPTSADLHHFVIAGVFKIHENALSQLDQLQKLVFKNAAVTEANNRWYVYYQGFEKRSDAILPSTISWKNTLKMYTGCPYTHPIPIVAVPCINSIK